MKKKLIKKLFAITTAVLMIFNTGMSGINTTVFANEGVTETTVQNSGEEQQVEVPETKDTVVEETTLPTVDDSKSTGETQATEENLGNEPNSQKGEVTQADVDKKGIPAKVISQTENSVTLLINPDSKGRAAKDQISVVTPYGSADEPGKWWHVKNRNGMVGSGGTYYYDVYARMTINGKRVYCVEPSVLSVHGASDYKEISVGDYIPDESLREKVGYASTLGYGFMGDTSEYMDFATQIAIWNILEPGNIYGVHPLVQEKVDIIMNRISVMYTASSFQGSAITLKGLGKEYAQTITDTTGTFHNYVTSEGALPSGLQYERSGDSLTVWTDNPINSLTKLKFNCYYFEDDASLGDSIIFDSPSSQDVGTFGHPDPADALLYVQTDLVEPLTLGKQDEDRAWVQGTDFKVSYNSDMSSPLVNPSTGGTTFTTGADGKVTVPSAFTKDGIIYGLNKDVVYVQEIGVPAHLVLDKTIYRVGLSRDTANSWNANNRWVVGKIKVVKKDAESGKLITISGAKFNVYSKATDSIVDTITTGSDGTATTKDLRYGEYYVKEQNAPAKYTLNSGQVINVFIQEDGKVYEDTFLNTRVKAKLTINKKDEITGGTAQGDATLAGAVFNLRAKENILDPADGSVVARAGDIVRVLTTNATGYAETGADLYLGKYYLEEKTPPEGYNPSDVTWDITFDDPGQGTALVEKHQDYNNRVISRPLELTKSFSDPESGRTYPLDGVQFTIKLKSDVDRLGWNNAPLAKNDKGKIARLMITNADGYARSERLPYGTYIVRETGGWPENSAPANPFQETITNDSENSAGWHSVINTPVKGYLRIQKVDADTGKTVLIAGAKFKVKNTATNKYFSYYDVTTGNTISTWTTDATGKVILAKALDYGNYQIEEIETPNGFLIDSSPVPFKMTYAPGGETSPDNGFPIVTVTKQNEEVHGKIQVEKTGEVLTGAVKQADGNYKFIYETKLMPNAVFKVYAEEIIYSQDGQGTILYNKDQLVSTLTTGADGTAITGEIPLGKYYVKEAQAPHGMVDTDVVKHIELKYKDDKTPIIQGNASFNNERQKVVVNASKKDADTDGYVAGAEFTMTADSAILDYKGTQILPVGTVIEKVITGEDGRAEFVSDLPVDVRVHVTETKAPDGYASTDKVVNLDTVYTDSSKTTQIYSTNFVNKPTVWEFTKEDITSQKEIDGAHLSVIDKDGKVVDEWVSSKDTSHIIKYLHVGEKYVLHEVLAPNGYLQAQDVEFVILDSGDIQSAVMRDAHVKGKITVTKIGESLTSVTEDAEGNLVFNYESKPQANAIFEVYAAEDIKHPDKQSDDFYKKGDLITTLTTGADGIATTQELPLGKYYVIEKTAPNGFVNNAERQDVELVYEDQNTALVFDTATVENQRQKATIQVVKKDFDTNDLLSGAVFGLYAKDDILGYDGTVLVKAGTLVEKSTSGDDGVAKFNSDLPLVNYEVKELKAPIGYSSSTEVVAFDATYQGQLVETIDLSADFANKITKVDVSKVDITDESEIEGAHLTVYEKGNKGSTFDTWVSGQDGKNEDGTIKSHLIKGLEVGKTYVLHETSSPYGFAIAQDVEFTIADTGDVQKAVMKDELVYGQLKWNKTGEIFMSTVTGQTEFGATQSPEWKVSNILGAQITIYAAEDIKIGNTTYYTKGQAVETLESDWDAVLSKKLPVGSYYYKETKVPHGYLVDTTPRYFEVEDSQSTDLQTISSTLDNKRPTFDIDMTKVMENQEVFKNGDAYKDVVFGIYARESIYNYMGDVSISYGTMISTTGITKEGHLVNVPDLPNGVYFIKELATNSQYKLNTNEYDFEIGYHGESVSKYVVSIGIEGKVENELARGQINVQKLDALDEKNAEEAKNAKDEITKIEGIDKVSRDEVKEVETYTGDAIPATKLVNHRLIGVDFNISAKEDMSEVLSTVATGNDGIASFKDLELGTYYIQEKGQVDGYILNNHIYKVEVTKDGDLLSIDVVNKPTEMTFSKVDETGSNELEGAKLQIIDNETGKVIVEWVSTKESHVIYYLVENKEYTMREITAPEGYDIATDIVFTAGDGIKITMKDELTPKPVTGVDSSTTGLVLLLGFGMLSAIVLLKNRKKEEN